MKFRTSPFLLLSVALLSNVVAVRAQTTPPKAPPPMYPVAIVSFTERGSGVKDYGSKVGDVLYGLLGTNEKIVLVDRQDMAATLTEHKLNLSGMVNPDEATRVGQLTGAKVLVTGSVMEVGKSLYLTAKIIGTETTRVLTESVKGTNTDDLATLAETLAGQVGARIVKDSTILVAAPESMQDVIGAINARLGNSARPAVTISIPERHIGQPTIDPAATTELALIAKATGFNVVESGKGSAPAPLQITGEGFSEFGERIGDLVSVKARVEIKIIDPATSKLLVADRQMVIVVDLSEQIAGKSALQKAASILAQRVLPQLVKTEKK